MYSAHVKVRGQLRDVTSLPLPLCRFLGSNLGHQGCILGLQIPVSVGPMPLPHFNIILFLRQSLIWPSLIWNSLYSQESNS